MQWHLVAWHFREFELGMEAEVTGPPALPEFEKRTPAAAEETEK